MCSTVDIEVLTSPAGSVGHRVCPILEHREHRPTDSIRHYYIWSRSAENRNSSMTDLAVQTAKYHRTSQCIDDSQKQNTIDVRL